MSGSSACDANYANYTSAVGAYKTNISKLYSPLQTQCEAQYPGKYPVNYVLQKTGLNDALKAQQAQDLQALNLRFTNAVANYTGMLATTKALIVATEPLKTYKNILQSQLSTDTSQVNSIKQKIASGANQINSVNSQIPDLSNTGPFGSTNNRRGIGIAFLVIYSLFFISLSAVLYLRFKESVQKSLLITGILILLGGAGTGAYFLSITNSYGLGMKPISI
jgi:hypothetical protein